MLIQLILTKSICILLTTAPLTDLIIFPIFAIQFFRQFLKFYICNAVINKYEIEFLAIINKLFQHRIFFYFFRWNLILGGQQLLTIILLFLFILMNNRILYLLLLSWRKYLLFVDDVKMHKRVVIWIGTLLVRRMWLRFSTVRV